MNKYDTNIQKCFWIEPKIFQDHRGIFSEIFKNSSSEPLFKSVQSNYSFSKKGVLRGVHRTPYAKYITCIHGEIYDVCVDLRPTSPTYEQHFGIFLNSNKLTSLYIPPFCGHAFLALTDSVLVYQQEQEYDPKLDETFCYKNYNIHWPYERLSNSFIVSEKDKNACNEKST